MVSSVMMPNERNSYVSSRMVKEVARLGGNFAQYVPERVKDAIQKKLTAGEVS